MEPRQRRATKLLSFRFYRKRHKASAALYRRAYGFRAAFHKRVTTMRRLGRSRFLAFLAAFFQTRLSNRWRPARLRLNDPRPSRRVRLPRRRRVRYQTALAILLRAAARDRYGISAGPNVFTADDRRRLRNARKTERRTRRLEDRHAV